MWLLTGEKLNIFSVFPLREEHFSVVPAVPSKMPLTSNSDAIHVYLFMHSIHQERIERERGVKHNEYAHKSF